MGVETRRWVWIGVDLGQRRDSSAIAVVERVWEQANAAEFLNTGLDGQWWFRVRMLERIRLDTSYPDVVRRVKEIAGLPQVTAEGRTVVVDGTGVGAPVVDLLRRAGLGCMIVPVILTGGGQPSNGPLLRGGYESVPRSVLLTGMQVLVQQGRLKVAARSREAETLRREMLGLKLAGKVTEVHDDLAVAVALALWKARAGVVVEAWSR
jgi:hypothetical protein